MANGGAQAANQVVVQNPAVAQPNVVMQNPAQSMLENPQNVVATQREQELLASQQLLEQ